MSSFTSKTIILLIILFSHRVVAVAGTVDVNLPEMRYLADHLQPEECRRLVAALHFKSYNQPNALDAAEGKVSEDIPCLRLLLHWNSSKDEGLGETHEMLFRRLRQIGRDDLAEWLGNTVFHQLGEDLKKSLEEPFDEFVSSTPESDLPVITEAITTSNFDPREWLPFDTICWTIILLLSVLTVMILLKSVIAQCKNKRRKQKHRKREYNDYSQMENDEMISESESEDRFDIRRQNDPALKLMGV